jgi:hypothetical protein
MLHVRHQNLFGRSVRFGLSRRLFWEPNLVVFPVPHFFAARFVPPRSIDLEIESSYQISIFQCSCIQLHRNGMLLRGVRFLASVFILRSLDYHILSSYM